MALSRNIPVGTATLKAGQWEKKRLQGREVFNKWLGVIGFGKIGSIVADRGRRTQNARDAFMIPLASPEQIEKAGFKSVGLEKKDRTADFVAVHVPKVKGAEKLDRPSGICPDERRGDDRQLRARGHSGRGGSR
ncbi:MAG: NAD(P)-dependent oxidoreductase [Deltaproteobacteria bacterium]|nr:NAD(P)-dependent oxidoreductase [Deltaproteobacteria bacterium]